MAPFGYKFYLLMFNSYLQSERSEQVEHKKIKFISMRGHVISSTVIWKLHCAG